MTSKVMMISQQISISSPVENSDSRSFCFDASNWLLPDGSLSPCFIDGPLQLAPSLVLAILGPAFVYRLAKRQPSRRETPWYVNGTITLVALQMAILLATAGLCYWVFGIDVRSITPALVGLTLGLGLAIHLLENDRSLVPSGLMLVYWPLSIVTTFMKVYNMYSRAKFQVQFYFALTCFSLFTQCGIFILAYVIPKRLRRYEKEETTLMDNADAYSKISLSWMNPLIVQASKAALTSDSLPEIYTGFKSARYSDKFTKNWQNRRSDSVSSFVWVLFKSFGPTLMMCAAYGIVYDSSKYLHPFLLQYLILFSKSYWEKGADAEAQPMSLGFYIALAMFVIAVVRTVLGSYTMMYALRTACGVKSALNNTVYRKSLVLSGKERESRSTGEIVNIMAVDVTTVTTMCYSITVLWEAPLEFVLCLISLNSLLGVSVSSVFVILCIFLPLNWFMTRFIKGMRRKQMRYKDQRTRLTTEIMTNVKSLKLYGWEQALLERLHHVRNALQLKNLEHLIYVSSILDFIWNIVPYCFSCATFALFVYLEDIPLTSDVVFPAMKLFSMMTGPISEIPRTMTQVIDCGVSLVRIRDFLCSGELQQDCVQKCPPAEQPGDTAVRVQDATFFWDVDSEPALKDINFEARKGDLSCIVGRVGAGKSSLLKSMLGDLHKSKGKVEVMGTVAYVSQDSWLMNATVRENIIFGGHFDPEFYKRTIEACALTQDLEILPDGDNTEIGERGVSLSGGQKARLSLARAVYARCDVYMMDDPLSAVDEHVGRHIIRNVLSSTGLLGDKTRILCTNAINVLTRADCITLLEHKTIEESGTYHQVMRTKGNIYELIREFGRQHQEDFAPIDEVVATTSSNSNSEGEGEGEGEGSGDSDTLAGSVEEQPLQRAKPAKYGTKKRRTTKVREIGALGRVKWHVYLRYAAACGKLALSGSFLVITSSSLVALGSNFWLKHWVESNDQHGYNADPSYWIGGFFLLGLTGALTAVLRKFFTRVLCGLRASRQLHDTMAGKVLGSPMSFFETTPVGRIINRFSSDINELDEGLPVAFVDMIRTIVKLVLALAVVIISVPGILVVVVPLSVLYHYYQRYYQSASREIKRLMSISRSPIFSHFQESLNGASTIRAFGQDNRFKRMNEANIDVNIRAIFLFRCTNRWLSFRLQTIGAAIVLATACSVVIGASKKAFTPGLIGIIMTYTLEVTDHLSHIVRSIVKLETSIVGVERVLEYCDLKGEAAPIVEDKRPPAYWPHDGKIQFVNYSTKYREDLDPILKNVSFEVNSREKIGVVGRTGAGKTSLVMALFRIIEPTSGKILVDGLDVTKMGLTDLRSNLSIIPQDSQIFEGTLRQNLDPFNLHSDTDIWRVLKLSHLHGHVANSMNGGLDAQLSEGGSNLSAGQRQLMCLGRALLHNSNVLVLDEATASVDVQTDKVVQETIRKEFKHKTIVTIAHRLNTIMDSDRIIVLDRGQVAEFDSPSNLLRDPSSLFYGLCKQGGFVHDLI